MAHLSNFAGVRWTSYVKTNTGCVDDSVVAPVPMEQVHAAQGTAFVFRRMMESSRFVALDVQAIPWRIKASESHLDPGPASGSPTSLWLGLQKPHRQQPHVLSLSILWNPELALAIAKASLDHLADGS